MNNIKRGKFANTIALHDFKIEDINVKDWFSFTEEFFLKNGLEPNKIAITGDKTVRSTKNIKYKTGKKRLEKFNFKNVGSIWIAALFPDEFVNIEMDDFFLCSYFSLENEYSKGSINLCFDDDIIPWNNNLIKELTSKLYHFSKTN